MHLSLTPYGCFVLPVVLTFPQVRITPPPPLYIIVTLTYLLLDGYLGNELPDSPNYGVHFCRLMSHLAGINVQSSVGMFTLKCYVVHL